MVLYAKESCTRDFYGNLSDNESKLLENNDHKSSLLDVAHSHFILSTLLSILFHDLVLHVTD